MFLLKNNISQKDSYPIIAKYKDYGLSNDILSKIKWKKSDDNSGNGTLFYEGSEEDWKNLTQLKPNNLTRTAIIDKNNNIIAFSSDPNIQSYDDLLKANLFGKTIPNTIQLVYNNNNDNIPKKINKDNTTNITNTSINNSPQPDTTWEKLPDWYSQIDNQQFRLGKPKAYNWMDSSQNAQSGAIDAVANLGYDTLKKKIMKDKANEIFGNIKNGYYERPITMKENLDKIMQGAKMADMLSDNAINQKRAEIDASYKQALMNKMLQAKTNGDNTTYAILEGLLANNDLFK